MNRVWVFADFSLPNPLKQKAWVAQIQALRVTDVVFGLNNEEDSDFHQRLPVERIKACAVALQAIGVHVHLMSWLRPHKAFIEAAAALLLPLCKNVGAASLLFDVEHYWAVDFDRHKEEALSSFKHSFPLSPSLPLGATSFTEIPPSVVEIIPFVDYAIPQAYSIWNPQKAWTIEPRYAPGPMQTLAAKRYKDAGAKKIVMGLAAYLQARPEKHQWESMKASLDATREAGIDEVAYWSLKWLGGQGPSGERARIVREIRGPA